MEKPQICVLHNLARSGGTLVSRCIGSMRGIILLSEIHPLTTRYFDPLQQAAAWHGLFEQEELDEFSTDFAGSIRRIEQRTRMAGKTLVIRDWAHLDYFAIPFLPAPTFRMQLIETLAGAFDIKSLSLVRHPVDLWLSMTRLDVIKEKLGLPAFLRGYLMFARQSQGTGFVRYEDFTNYPVRKMQEICGHLGLEYDQDFLTNWSTYRKVTGDVSKQSRGSVFHEIVPLKRPGSIDPRLLRRFRENPDYREALELLGYQDVGSKNVP